MQIVLDTNVLQKDFRLRSKRIEMLLDFVQRTLTTVVIPELVLQELTANFARNLRTLVIQQNEIDKKIASLLSEDLEPRPAIDVDAAVRSLRSFILRRFGLPEDEPQKVNTGWLPDVVDRAIHRRAPCHRTGQQFRDALLWHVVLELAREKCQPVVLISNNKADFSLDGTTLHPELDKEAKQQGAEVTFYSSLESFLEDHATPIAFISGEWLSDALGSDAMLDEIQKELEPSIIAGLSSLIRSREQLTGYHTILGRWIGLEHYFVYGMQDGSTAVESRWQGEFEYEYEILTTETLYAGDVPPPDIREARPVVRTASFQFTATDHAIIVDEQVRQHTLSEIVLG